MPSGMAAFGDFRYGRARLSTNLSFGTGGVGLDHIQAQEDYAAGLIPTSLSNPLMMNLAGSAANSAMASASCTRIR